MDYQSLFIILVVAAIPVVTWAVRLWLKATIERSVQTKFETALEEVRSDLRIKEGKIAALQTNALSGRAGRQALLDKRRIEAIEKLWAASLQLDVFKPAAATITLMKLDALSKRAPDEPRLRELIAAMKGTGSKEQLTEIGGEAERLFVPEEVWAIFSAYKSVLGFCFMRLEALALGMEDTDKLFLDSKIIELVKTVLPSHADYLDQTGITGVAYSVETLQMRLLAALRHALEGGAADEENVERTNQILKLVQEADTALAKEAGEIT